jgi:hypothetical protein
MAWCEKLLEDLSKHEDAWPFLEPVNTRQFPTYKKVQSRGSIQWLSNDDSMMLRFRQQRLGHLRLIPMILSHKTLNSQKQA